MLIHQHTLLFESNAEKETSRIGIIDPACKVRRETSSDLPRPMSCWTKKETRQNLSHSTRQIPSSPELDKQLIVCVPREGPITRDQKSGPNSVSEIFISTGFSCFLCSFLLIWGGNLSAQKILYECTVQCVHSNAKLCGSFIYIRTSSENVLNLRIGQYFANSLYVCKSTTILAY